MKSSYFLLIAALVLTSCHPKKKKSGETQTNVGATAVEGTKGSSAVPVADFVDSNDPLDTYLSIGPYLQKEFDALDINKTPKKVKLFLQVRQENSSAKNFASLKELLGPLDASIKPALESAEKNGFTTVEFSADVGALKTSVTMINAAASGIELSLGSVE